MTLRQQLDQIANQSRYTPYNAMVRSAVAEAAAAVIDAVEAQATVIERVYADASPSLRALGRVRVEALREVSADLRSVLR